MNRLVYVLATGITLACATAPSPASGPGSAPAAPAARPATAPSVAAKAEMPKPDFVLSADLKIAEVVDVPHMLVTMHLPKAIFQKNATAAR